MKILLLAFVGFEAFIDVRKKEILLWPLIVAIVAGIVFNLITAKNPISAILTGFIVGIFTAVVSLCSRGGIGMGDALLLMIIGLFLGFENTLQIFFWALLLAAVVGLIFLIKDRNYRKKRIAFVPFLLVGMVGVFICA